MLCMLLRRTWSLDALNQVDERLELKHPTFMLECHALTRDHLKNHKNSFQLY
jgi:hypothetical protein